MILPSLPKKHISNKNNFMTLSMFDHHLHKQTNIFPKRFHQFLIYVWNNLPPSQDWINNFSKSLFDVFAQDKSKISLLSSFYIPDTVVVHNISLSGLLPTWINFAHISQTVTRQNICTFNIIHFHIYKILTRQISSTKITQNPFHTSEHYIKMCTW